MKSRASKRSLANGRSTKRRRGSLQAARSQPRQRLFACLEPLESRLLMATIDYTVNDPDSYLASNPNGLLDGDVDLVLRVADVRGTPMLQLVDLDLVPGGQVVGAAPFTDSIQVNITGYQTSIQGQTEEFPESLLIDLGNATGLNPAAVALSVNFDGIQGTAVPLLTDDVITIAPSSSTVYAPASLDVTLIRGDRISVQGSLVAAGNISLTADQGDIEVLNGGSIAGGDITLTATSQVTAQSEADSADALAMPSATITISGGELSGDNITLAASAITDVTISATDLRDGQFSVGGILAISNASIVIDQNSQLDAAGNLVLTALSDVTTVVTRGTEDDGDASDDDKDQDAAIAISAVTSSAGIVIRDTSALSAGGTATIDATNLVNVTTTADGTLQDGDSSGNGVGGTLATATVVGDTEVIVQDLAAITAAGDLSMGATSNRTVTTTSIATPGGATDDGDSNTSTQGQDALASNDASTADGNVTLAAAIAVNTVMGETRTRISGGTLTSMNGDIAITSSASHNVQTIADGTVTSGEEGTGVGIAVAIGLSGVTDPNGATALRSTATVDGQAHLSASTVSVQALMPESTFHTEATSGQSGPSEDENGDDTGADVGVAGALAIGVAITDASARLEPTASVNANGANFHLAAQSTTNSTVKALPKEAPVSGESLGVGASVAINITDHITRAEIQDGAKLTNADDVSVSSTSFQGVTTLAKTGAAGGTAIAASVALALGNHDTVAELGTGSDLQTTGNITVTATHLGTNATSSEGDAEGSEDAAIGAAFAMSLLEDNTLAAINRSVDSGGAITVAAIGNSASAASAKASAKGEDDDSGSANDANTQNASQRGKGDDQASSRGARDSNGAAANPDASTSNGSVTVAAALALNIANTTSQATIADGVTLHADGKLSVFSNANTDASATADGSATQGDVGVGAAVAINVATIDNSATIGSGASITADGLSLNATMNDAVHTTGAQATSGAGGKDVGVAGSLAINHVESNTRAAVLAGASVTLVDGPDPGTAVGAVTINALSITNNTSHALPNVAIGGAMSESVGVGASVALNLSYGETTTEIQDGVSWNGGAANSLTVDATAVHTFSTTAQNGAKGGGVGVGGAVAVVISKNHTTARIGDGPGGAINTVGAATVKADHSNTLATQVGSMATGSDAAIGASVGVVIVEDTADAELARDLTAGGNVSVTSEVDVNSTLDVQASAGGGDENGDDADTEADKQANQPNASNNGGNTVPKASDNTDSANSKSEEESSSSGGGVGIAATVAVNALSIKNSASITNGADVTAGGSVSVSAPAHVVSHNVADSSAIDTSGDVSIGAAVALNWVSLTNTAEVNANSTITGNGITVEAVTTDNQTNDFTATAFAVAGNTGDTAVAGVLALNVVDADTTAVTRDNSHLYSTGSVHVTAEHAVRVQAAAIAGAVSDGVSVAAAVAINLVGLSEQSETGGSRTVASIGDPDSNGLGATVNAMGAVNVVASHTVGMFPILDLPESLNNPDDPDYAIDDITEPVASVAVSGGGSTGSFAAAGSAGINLFETTTMAGVDRRAEVDGGSIVVSAIDTTNLVTMAGALGVAADGAGIGLGLDLAIIHKDTRASIAKEADITTTQAVQLAASSHESLVSVAATAGIGNSVGAAGSAAVQVVDTSTRAEIENSLDPFDGASIVAGGTVSVTADGTFETRLIAGSAGAGGTVGVGASNTTLVHNDVVEASVGGAAHVSTSAGLTAHATSSEDLITIAAAGGAAGSVGVAGAAVVNVLNETTRATIGNGAQITASNGFALGTPHLHVAAHDDTTIVSVAGSLAASGGVGAGIGADVATINKTTVASIGSKVTAAIEGNVLVDATSRQDITSAAAGLAASASASVSLDASVHVLDVTTRAYIGDDPIDMVASLGAGDVHAGGNVVVSAEDQTEIDKVVGVAAVSGGAGIAGGAAVSTVNKSIEAFIGEGAKVTADGKTAPVSVPTGRFVTSFTSAAPTTNGLESNSTATMQASSGDLRASGEVGLPNIGDIDTDTNQNGNSDANDPSLSEQRTLTPEMLNGFRGVAVTATNRDDIEDYTISAAGGTAAIAISAGVNIINVNTLAYVGQFAKVNENTSTGHADQSVHVAAGSDFAHVAFAGSVAGGAVGIAPAASVTVVNNSTEAYLGWYRDSLQAMPAPATVNARNDVTVEAHASEDILLVGIGAAAGWLGIGAGVDVLVLNNHTHAAVGPNSNVLAGGNVVVLATDDTDIDVIAAGAAGGVVAGGGAAGILSLTKDTQAWIDTQAVVDGRGANDGVAGILNGVVEGDGDAFDTTTAHGVIVQAQSTENIFHLALAAGGGFVGVAGGVTVSLIDSDTRAEIRDDTAINKNNNQLADDNQSVYVNAANEVRVATFAGAVAGGAGALGGAVDVGTLKNDTLARIGSGAQVAAANDVEVNGLGIKELDGFTFSGSGGAVGLAGAVSIWSIGTPLRKTYSDDADNQASAADRKDGAADEDATSQAAVGQSHLASGLDSFQAAPNANAKSNSARVDNITSLAGLRMQKSAPGKSELDAAINSGAASAGTSAVIEDGAEVTAGFAIEVEAYEDVQLDISVGGFGGGLAGAGGAVGVLSVAANASAYSGGTLSAGGHVHVMATLDQDVPIVALAGGVGFVGLGAAVVDLTDASTVQAAVGGVESASSVKVLADADQQLTVETGQLTGGGLAAGASFTRLVADGAVAASVLGGAQIGQVSGKTVGSLEVQADSAIIAHNTTVAIAAGGVAVSANFAIAEVSPDVAATVGFGADIDVPGNVSVEALAEHDAVAEVLTLAGGIVSVGASLATATLEGSVSVDVANAATMEAAGITLQSRFNHNGVEASGSQAKAHAQAPSKVPGLAAGTGTQATAVASTDVSTLVGEDTQLTSNFGGIVVRALGSHVADAEGLAVSHGLAAAVGITKVNAIANGDTIVNVQGGMDSAAALTVAALANNQATAHAEASAIAGFGGASGASATATASPAVHAMVDGEAIVRASDAIAITTAATNDAVATADGGAFGAGAGIGQIITLATTSGQTKSLAGSDIRGASVQVTTTAINTATAEALSAAGGFVGSGSSVTAEVVNAPHFAAEITGKVRADGAVTVLADTTNTTTATAKTIALSGGASDGGASATVTSQPTVEALIVGGANVSAVTSLTVKADDVSTVSSTAGATSASFAAHGSGLATNVVGADVTAAIHNGLHSGATVTVQATETSTVTAEANGLVAGGLSLAGGQAVNDVSNATTAEIVNDVFINPDQPGAGDVVVDAQDTSDVTALVDQASVAGFGAAGAGMAFSNVQNQTRSSIAMLAHVATAGNVIVTAYSDATIHDTAVGVAVALGAGVAGNVAVNVIENDVEASITKQSVVSAGNNVLVQAQSDNKLSASAATVAGGLFGDGGTVIVNTFDNVTRAFIDEASVVSAGGVGPGLQITKWDSAGQASLDTLDGLAVIAHSVVRPADDPDGGGPLPPTTLRAFNAAGGLAGLSSINAVNTIHDVTEAFIASSTINSPTKLGDDVLVRAHSDQLLHIQADGVAAGVAGVGGTLSRSSIASQTRAFISDNDESGKDTTFQASDVYGKNVEVSAVSRERIELDVTGVTGGVFALAGSVSVAEIAADNQAFVRDSQISSQGHLAILANDVASIGGSVRTASVGAFAGGAAVAFNSITNLVQARVLGGQLWSDQDLTVQAGSDEAINTQLHALGEGLVSLAGSVAINTIETTTEATVESGDQFAQINQTPPPGLGQFMNQSVTIAANDSAEIINDQGATAGGLGAGVGAAVEASSIRNRTVAKVGPQSRISATGDVTIDAHGTRNLDSTVTGFGGGIVGLSGAVSLLTLGAPTASDINVLLTEFLNQDADGNSLQDQTDSTSAMQDVAGGISDKPGSPSSSIAQKAGDRVNSLADPNVLEALTANSNDRVTAAYVEDAATAADKARIVVGGNVAITALNEYDVTQTVGTENVGLAAIGASIAITTVRNVATASLGNFNTIEATGDVVITAGDVNSSVQPIDISVVGGAAGVVALDFNIADLTLSSDTTARIGSQAEILRGNDVTIGANQVAHVDATGKGFGLAAAAAAGSVKVTPTITVNTSATIEDGAVIGGMRSVASLQTKATSVNTVDNGVTVGHAALGGGISEGLAATTITPTVSAHVGAAQVNVRGATVVSALAIETVTSKIESLAAGIVGDGSGISNVTVSGSVTGDVASNATIDSGSLIVSADQIASLDTTGIALGGGLVGGIAAEATATVDMDVLAVVGDATVTTDGPLSVLANSNSTATATSGSLGITGFGEGGSTAEATISGEVGVQVLSGATIQAGRAVHVLASADNTATATSQATKGGIVDANAASTSARIDVDTLAAVQNSSVVAGDEVRVESQATNQANAESIGATVALISAVGHVESEALVEGSTRALADGIIHTANGYIRVQAHDQDSHAVANSKAAGGGIGFSSTATTAHASVQPSADDQQPQVRARLAGNVSAAGDIAVRAKSTDTSASATASGISLAAGVASGGTQADSLLSQSIRASIGNGSSINGGKNVKVEALNQAGWSTANASASGGALLAGLAGAEATASATASVASIVGDASVNAAGMVLVQAAATNLASATGDGVAIGGLAGVGDVGADATAGNVTTAGIESGAGISAANVVVESISSDRAKSDVEGTGGGLVSLNASTAATHVSPAVLAYVGDNVTVDAGDDVRITSDARSEGDAEARANAYGAVAIGQSRAHVDLAPDVASLVGIDAQIAAGHDVIVEAISGQTPPTDGSGTTRATAQGSGASAFVGAFGSKATVDAQPIVKALIGERTGGNVPNITAGHDVRVSAESAANVLSESNNASIGLGASQGTSIAIADIQHTNNAVVAAHAEIVAGNNLSILSLSVDSPQAHATAAAGSAVASGARAESQATVDHQTRALVNVGAHLQAGDTVTVQSTSDSQGISTAHADSGSLVSSSNANAGNDAGDLEVGGNSLGVVIQGDTTTTVGENAVVEGRSVELIARIERTDGESISNAHTAVGPADIDAVSRVALYDDAIVNVFANAEVTGTDTVTLWAETTNVRVNSDAVTKVDGVGGANSDAIGHVDSDALVVTEPDALITTHALDVRAVGLTGATPFHVNATATGTVNGANEKGDFDPDRTITFDADVVLTSGSAVLVIAADGTVLERDGVTFSPMTASGNVDPAATTIVVDPIVNNHPGSALFQTNPVSSAAYGDSSGGAVVQDAPLGFVRSLATIAGTDPFNITFRETLDAVRIENHSTRNLVINDIQVVNTTESPDVTIDTERIELTLPTSPPSQVDIFGFDIVQSFEPTRIEVLQLTPLYSADIILAGQIDNPIGTTHIHNQGGDVLSGNSQAVVRSNVLNVEANGDIGDAVNRLKVELVASEGQPEQSFDGISPEPGFSAGGQVWLDVRGVNRDASISGFSVDVGPVSGSGVDILLRPAIQELGPPNTSFSVDVAVLPATPLPYDKHFRPDGSGPVSDLPLGIFGTGAQEVDATYSFQAIPSSGDVTIATIPGGGSIDINATTDVSDSGIIHVATDGNIDLTETSGDLPAGLIVSTGGNVTLTSLSGAIIDALGDSAVNISGKDVSLDTNGGAAAKLGEANDPLEICATGLVQLQADGGIPNVHNACGGVKIQLIQVNVGTVSVSSAGTLELVDGATVFAPAGATFNAAGNLAFAATSRIVSEGVIGLFAGSALREGSGADIRLDGDVQALQLDVHGSSGDDRIVLKHTLDRGITQVFGGAGNDVIDASAMVDRLFAHGDRGDDTILGGSASDLLWGDEGDDILSGGAGNDALMGGEGEDHLYGNDGRDLLFGGLGVDSLFGGADDDVLVGGEFKPSDRIDRLDVLLAIWGGSESYLSRVVQMRRQGFKSATAPDNRTADRLKGEEGTDWFWSYSRNVTDKQRNERSR